MKELDYIRYERCDTGEWYRTFAGKGRDEFELVGTYHYSLTHNTLHYKGECYTFKEFIDAEILWDYIDLFGDDEVDGLSNGVDTVDRYKSEYKLTLVFIIILICLLLIVFPMFLE